MDPLTAVQNRLDAVVYGTFTLVEVAAKAQVDGSDAPSEDSVLKLQEMVREALEAMEATVPLLPAGPGPHPSPESVCRCGCWCGCWCGC